MVGRIIINYGRMIGFVGVFIFFFFWLFRRDDGFSVDVGAAQGMYALVAGRYPDF